MDHGGLEPMDVMVEAVVPFLQIPSDHARHVFHGVVLRQYAPAGLGGRRRRRLVRVVRLQVHYPDVHVQTELVEDVHQDYVIQARVSYLQPQLLLQGLEVLPLGAAGHPDDPPGTEPVYFRKAGLYLGHAVEAVESEDDVGGFAPIVLPFGVDRPDVGARLLRQPGYVLQDVRGHVDAGKLLAPGRQIERVIPPSGTDFYDGAIEPVP